LARILKNYRIKQETIDYIEKVALQQNISRQAAVDFIADEHKKSNKTSVMLVAEAIGEYLRKDLVRIRLGTNNADKNSQILIELLNHLFIANEFKGCITTSQFKADGLRDAEIEVKERIEHFRTSKLERENSKG